MSQPRHTASMSPGSPPGTGGRRSAALGWETESGRGSPWARRVAALAVVAVVIALLLRGGDDGSALVVDAAPGAPAGDTAESVGSPESPEPEGAPTAPGALRVHTLDPGSLADRTTPRTVPLDLGGSATALQTDGRALLAVAVEAAPEDDGRVTARLDVFDAETLEPAAALGRVLGPVEQLAVSPDRTAVLWVQPGKGGAADRLHRVPIDPAPATSVTLPTGLAVRSLQALPNGHVAVAADAISRTARRSTGADATLLVHDLRADATEPVLHVPLDGIGALEPARGRAAMPALVWDVDGLVLHVARADADLLTSIDLQDGSVATVGDPRDLSTAGAVVRQARLEPQTGLLVVTGTLQRPFGRSGLDLTAMLPPGTLQQSSGRSGVDLDAVLPLGTLLFSAPAGADAAGGGETASPGDAAGAARAHANGGIAAREEAQLSAVIAARAGRVVLAAGGPGRRGRTATQVRVVDTDLVSAGANFAVDGRILAAEMDRSGDRLVTARRVPAGVAVAVHDLGSGMLLQERHFAEDTVVHIGPAAVSIIVVAPHEDADR